MYFNKIKYKEYKYGTYSIVYKYNKYSSQVIQVSADWGLHTMETMVWLLSDHNVKDNLHSFNVLCIITAQKLN